MRRATLLLALLALALPVSTVEAAPTIRVKLQVAEGYYPASGATSPYLHRSEPCTVVLRPRATAYDTLVAARQQRCLRSFAVTTSSLGHYLTCVDGRCETTGFYWALYLSRDLTCTGLDDIRMRNGDTLTLSYESVATAAALVLCPTQD